MFQSWNDNNQNSSQSENRNFNKRRNNNNFNNNFKKFNRNSCRLKISNLHYNISDSDLIVFKTLKEKIF